MVGEGRLGRLWLYFGEGVCGRKPLVSSRGGSFDLAIYSLNRKKPPGGTIQLSVDRKDVLDSPKEPGRRQHSGSHNDILDIAVGDVVANEATCSRECENGGDGETLENLKENFGRQIMNAALWVSLFKDPVLGDPCC